ncbi:aldehyde dehydrogenase family protein [Arthrobacter psychrolactophilus]|uniref:aldehyde dehydrogenase family protein n=1 Tax=Arthrobacter psychrolactophilus TaxID=92442 RepID=UPI0026783599
MELLDHHGAGATATPDQDIVTISPLDGSLVGRMPAATANDVAEACSAASLAGKSWAATSPHERGQVLQKCAAAVGARALELAELNHAETGRPADQALEGVLAGVSTLEQYAQLGPIHRGRSLCGGELATDYTVQCPRGVVAALTPWNDPVAVACGILGAALAMGNTVVHKPSERCPQVGARLGNVLAEVLPAGVLQTLCGGPHIGALLAADAHVAVIAHVGSSATGAALRQIAAGTGAHTILENGGNDPLLVDSDVDPVWAAQQAAVGAFSNSGQICTAVERIYVHRDIAAEFLAALEAEAVRINEAGSLGPLVDERLRKLVHGQVSGAVADGAVATVGGIVPGTPGAYYPATVLRECTGAMTVMQEETFGPVAPVQVVDSFAEGLRLAAGGRYGLAATVLTSGLGHAQQAVAELDTGTVKINNVFGGAPGGAAQPRRTSGAGFGYGPELLDEMACVKVVHIEPAPSAGEPDTAP